MYGGLAHAPLNLFGCLIPFCFPHSVPSTRAH